MTRASSASAVIALSVMLAGCAAQPIQAPEWRLTRPLSEAEKTEVLALVTRLNLGQPAVIASEVIHQPLSCEALRINSVPVSKGNRRTWQRVWVANTEWARGCPRWKEPDSPQVGSWVVADRAQDVGAWHVRERDGFVEVETPSTIPYGDVAAIVEAVKAGRLVDRLPPGYRIDRRRLPKVDAQSMLLIWNSHLDPALYEVKFRATNVVLVVAVRGTAVELRGWMTEVA